MKIDKMPSWVRAFIIACTFLTRLPLPQVDNYQAADAGRALPMFPAAGLLMGLILLTAGELLHNHLNTAVLAALLLTLWVLLSGALHLDGLGDSADGWLSGGDKERTLAIMKDPRSGSAAVVVIGLIMILKFAALEAIVANQNLLVLLLTPMLARAGALFLLMTTDYVSHNGIAQDFLRHACPRHLQLALALSLLLAFILWPLQTFLAGLLLAALTGWGLRLLMLKRLGGITGDTSGATIEIIEAVILVAALIH